MSVFPEPGSTPVSTGCTSATTIVYSGSFTNDTVLLLFTSEVELLIWVRWICWGWAVLSKSGVVSLPVPETWGSMDEAEFELLASGGPKCIFCYIWVMATDSLEFTMMMPALILSWGIEPLELTKKVCDDIIVFWPFFYFYAVFEIESSIWISCRFLATAVWTTSKINIDAYIFLLLSSPNY